MTDEGYSLLYDDEANLKPKSVVSSMSPETLSYRTSQINSTKDSVVESTLFRVCRMIGGWSSFCLLMLHTHLPEFSVDVIKDLRLRCTKIIGKIQLYKEGYYLKRLAKTKRQFFYLLEKKALNVPYTPGETEIDTYLGCKSALKPIWPFMWEVSNVKDAKIKCCNIDCIPMSSYR